jgi:hypothetical protein
METMRSIRLHARLPIAAALGVAIAATALVGAARAEDGRAFDEQIIHNLLTGLGLKDPNAAQPTYEERPPLVIPQGDALPPPQQPGAAIANNPAWPKDPDVMRAKALAKREKNRDVEAEMLREENPLPPSQLGPTGAGPRQAGMGAAPGDNPSGTRARVYSPSELGYKGGIFDNMFGGDKEKQEAARFTGEPARTSLTEPPPGYQTPSPDQPYGLGRASTTPQAEDTYVSKGQASPDQ